MVWKRGTHPLLQVKRDRLPAALVLFLCAKLSPSAWLRRARQKEGRTKSTRAAGSTRPVPAVLALLLSPVNSRLEKKHKKGCV